MNWYQSLGIRPTIQKLQEKFEKIRLEELQKTREYLKDLNETQWSQIDYLTQRVIKNILHEPLTQLKENVDGKYMLNLSQVLKDLFRLEEYQK
jgi:glutamyl-tRNA reductase